MMDRCQQHLLLLWMIAVIAMSLPGNIATVVEEDELVKDLTNKSLQVLPPDGNSSVITTLLMDGNQIALNEQDRNLLATYPRLVELHLDGNLVTNISAKYFSVVPQLRVLSLSRNKITSLDPESLSGLENLSELDLSYNLLTSLPSKLLIGLNHVKVLDLQGNPWNCSCELLSSIREITAAGVTNVGLHPTCASPERQAGEDLLEATAKCYPPLPPPPSTVYPRNPPRSTVHVQQPLVPSSTLPKALLTSTQNNSINRDLDQMPVLGNTWKFTACVAALALVTFILILGAIKGPSCYKLFHNYRHRRLHQEEADGEGVVSTVFAKTKRDVSHQTFTFEEEDRQIEEEEDGYFEDPYIRREE